jgi:hypothetical protein
MPAKQSIYQVWKEVVAAMGEAGLISSEAVRRQERVLDFADMRENHSPSHIRRWGEFGLEKLLRVLTRPATVGVIAATLYFGCHVEWFAALVMGFFTEIVLRKLRLLLWFVFRALQVNVYILARLNAEKAGMDIYEARDAIEYMHDPEISFEKELLERDLYGFGYPVSVECLRGKCHKCKGKPDQLHGDKANLPCFHHCHKPMDYSRVMDWSKPTISGALCPDDALTERYDNSMKTLGFQFKLRNLSDSMQRLRNYEWTVYRSSLNEYIRLDGVIAFEQSSIDLLPQQTTTASLFFLQHGTGYRLFPENKSSRECLLEVLDDTTTQIFAHSNDLRTTMVIIIS